MKSSIVRNNLFSRISAIDIITSDAVDFSHPSFSDGTCSKRMRRGRTVVTVNFTANHETFAEAQKALTSRLSELGISNYSICKLSIDIYPSDKFSYGFRKFCRYFMCSFADAFHLKEPGIRYYADAPTIPVCKLRKGNLRVLWHGNVLTIGFFNNDFSGDKFISESKEILGHVLEQALNPQWHGINSQVQAIKSDNSEKQIKQLTYIIQRYQDIMFTKRTTFAVLEKLGYSPKVINSYIGRHNKEYFFFSDRDLNLVFNKINYLIKETFNEKSNYGRDGSSENTGNV